MKILMSFLVAGLFMLAIANAVSMVYVVDYMDAIDKGMTDILNIVGKK